MTLQHAVVDRILFIRWQTTPDESDVTAMDAAMQAAAQQLEGAPWFHVSVLFADIQMPSSAVQKALMRRIIKLRAKAQTLHCVYPGTSIKDAIVRRFLKGMVTMMGMRGKAFIHGTVEEAVKQLAPSLGQPVDAVVNQARASGIVPDA